MSVPAPLTSEPAHAPVHHRPSSAGTVSSNTLYILYRRPRATRFQLHRPTPPASRLRPCRLCRSITPEATTGSAARCRRSQSAAAIGGDRDEYAPPPGTPATGGYAPVAVEKVARERGAAVDRAGDHSMIPLVSYATPPAPTLQLSLRLAAARSGHSGVRSAATYQLSAASERPSSAGEQQ